jgi:hypothetical protein
MYPWIWRHLPGPTWFRGVEAVALIALVVAFLFLVGFPALDQYWPWTEGGLVTE